MNKSDRGFTLLELMVVLLIVGIIAAIAVPNFIGLLNRIRVRDSLEKLLGAIQESQKLSIRHGKTCYLNINPNTNVISSNDSQCLLNERIINEDIVIRTNLSGSIPNIYFSHKGNTTKMGTIVLSSNFTKSQVCFVISLGLGIKRTGIYTGDRNGSVSAQKCEKAL